MNLNPIHHVKEFIASKEANSYYLRLLGLNWKEVTWGTGRKLPRLIYRYDDDNVEVLNELISLIEITFDTKVKGVWCNQYRSGNDWTPEHQDSYGSDVFTLSFGESRTCYFRNLQTKERRDFLLESGDLLYFTPEIDATHKHCVPKTKKNKGIRISVVLFADSSLK